MSTYKRQELEKRLPQAAKSMLVHILGHCAEASVPVSHEDLIFIGRSVVDYLTTTADGKRAMLKLLNPTVTEASYTKQYYKAGHVGDESQQLDYKKLYEFRGWIYDGKARPHGDVAVWDKPDLENCEMCQGLFPRVHCVQIVKTTSNGKEHLENICNHCRLVYDDPSGRIRDTASSKTCETCAIKTCRYHPSLLRQHQQIQSAAESVFPLRQITSVHTPALEYRPR